MGYYTALQTAWATSSASSGALPSGVTGTSLFGLSTANKIAAVNAWMVVVPKPAVLGITSVINAIAPADFLALTATQIAQMQLCLGSDGQVNASPGTTVRAVFQSIFAGKTTTLANLTTLVSPYDNNQVLWTALNGYPTLSDNSAGNLSLPDASAAGLT